MMKIIFVFPALLVCSSLMLVQSAYAVKNPRDTIIELRQKIEKLEKEKQKQLTTTEKVRTLDERYGGYGQSNQLGQTAIQPRFEPYSYP